MEVKVYISQWLSDDRKTVHQYVASYDSSACCKNHILAYEGTVQIPEPDHNLLVLAQIARLREAQGKLIAESNEIEGRIQSLQCIEHKPEGELL